MGITCKIWISNPHLIKGIIGLILSDAISGKAATGGALGATVLIGFIYSSLTLQAGFSPSSSMYASDQMLSPRQAGKNAVLEPLFFSATVVIFTATVLLFTGNMGAYRYTCTTPFRIGFERATTSTLPTGWNVIDTLPSDPSVKHHYDGKRALEYEGNAQNPDSIFIPPLALSKDKPIRFAYIKYAGNMTVSVLKRNGEPIGKLELGKNNNTIKINNEKALWLEGDNIEKKWGYFILHSADLSSLGIKNADQVMLQIIPEPGNTHWILDRFEPVESPETFPLFVTSFKTLFPKSGNTLLGLLSTLLISLCLITWITFGQSAMAYLFKEKWALHTYLALGIVMILSAPFVDLKLSPVVLYSGILILLLINASFSVISIRKHKEVHQ